MCGILGQIETREPVDRAAFARMLATLAARGPDGEGTRIFCEGHVALGHRRLAIHDLSAQAAQPMPNEDASLWLCFNGEIYNFRELRKELESRGHRFRSQADSEVILHAYEEWGDDCVLRLRGIFAFGLWDDRRERLLLARDRLGVKPLYLWPHAGGLVFASQPRAILEHPRFRREVDAEAFAHYLAYRYVPGELAIWAGMQKLGAAQRLVWERGSLRRERYWQLHCAPSVQRADEAVELVRSKLEEALRLQLTSDVPLGVFLSGGIDSSAVAALASRALGRPIPSFTIGFDDPAADERPFARIASAAFGTQPHEQALSRDAARALLPAVAAAYDEPFFDPSSLPSLAVARLARAERVPVVLSGDGGDELFAGYRWYEPPARERAIGWRLAPRWLRDPQREFLARHFARVSPLGPRGVPELLAATPGFDPLAFLRRLDRPGLPRVTRLQLLDLQSFLVDDVLLKVDHASMASGVEVRVPLLDHELVEAVFSIESSLLFAGGERKALFKRAAASWLPRELLTPRKQGFGLPLAGWLRGGLRAEIAAALSDSVLVARGLVPAHAVARVLGGSALPPLWLLFAAELWARHWLEPAAPPLNGALARRELAA